MVDEANFLALSNFSTFTSLHCTSHCHFKNYFLSWKELSPDYITFPPVLRNFSNEELKEGLKKGLNLPDFPCHSRGNEMNVKQTSLSVAKNIGEERQKSSIVVTNDSRRSHGSANKFKKVDL